MLPYLLIGGLFAVLLIAVKVQSARARSFFVEVLKQTDSHASDVELTQLKFAEKEKADAHARYVQALKEFNDSITTGRNNDDHKP